MSRAISSFTRSFTSALNAAFTYTLLHNGRVESCVLYIVLMDRENCACNTSTKGCLLIFTMFNKSLTRLQYGI